MKKILLIIPIIVMVGCATSPSGKVVQTEAVVIPSVNAAMSVWSSYVSSGKATQNEINLVQTAYNAYYTAQLGAEAAVLEAAASSTNAIDQTAASTAVTNAENQLINLITQFTK